MGRLIRLIIKENTDPKRLLRWSYDVRITKPIVPETPITG